MHANRGVLVPEPTCAHTHTYRRTHTNTHTPWWDDDTGEKGASRVWAAACTMPNSCSGGCGVMAMPLGRPATGSLRACSAARSICKGVMDEDCVHKQHDIIMRFSLVSTPLSCTEDCAEDVVVAGSMSTEEDSME
eukprot:1152030-Pelagomonas_calceolata.AAC.17